VVTPIDPATGLTGAQRDAATAIQDTFNSFGLGSLAPNIINYLKQGYSPDTVSVLLQQTPQYQQRFSANAARLKAGLPVLSPSQYLATEQAYRQVLQKWGTPKGFYDQTSDFTNFLAQDMSPAELDQRAQKASDFVTRNDPQQMAYFKQYYSQGDMIAFALDPTKAAPLVGKAFDASTIGGTASTQGINIGQGVAERLAGEGVTAQQAQQGFGIVATDEPTAKSLGDIYGGGLTQDELISGTFENDAAANLKLKNLASQERAAFQGHSAILDSSSGKGSLSDSSGGF
jgi:hypothetical protein